MGQNRTSGQSGNSFGHQAAARVAEILGTKLEEQDNSNVVSIAGKLSVIKSAHKPTGTIGITKSMLPKLDSAYAVLEWDNDQFEIFRVDRSFLETKKKAGGKSNLWYYSRGDIKRHGMSVGIFDLSQPRRFWVTTQWPHRVDTDPDAPRQGVYLPNGREEAGANLSPGDLVAIYEAKTGRALVRKDVAGNKEVVKCHEGRQGIVALLRVDSKLCSDEESTPQRYSDGTEIWWRWYADAEPYSTSGFVPREALNRILGYAPGNPLRGFGDLNSGLKNITLETYEKIATAFAASGALPEMEPTLRNPVVRRGGTGGEGPIHRAIKEAVAADPSGVLGEPGLRTIRMEYPFPTGDQADILLEDALGRVIGVEVEPAVGDRDLPGILQAIKYRHMGALMRNKRPADSRAFLVAAEISPMARKICDCYEVECFIVKPEE